MPRLSRLLAELQSQELHSRKAALVQERLDETADLSEVGSDVVDAVRRAESGDKESLWRILEALLPVAMAGEGGEVVVRDSTGAVACYVSSPSSHDALIAAATERPVNADAVIDLDSALAAATNQSTPASPDPSR